MSDNQLPCADKLAFDTKQLAEAEARHLKWRRDIELWAYKCKHCSLWHLSSSPED